MKTKVINLFAGPGAGKSTTAAGLFNLMKLSGEKVELVTEYAKDLTYEKNSSILGNQMTVLGEQFHRLFRLKGQVEWIITDSPLLLGTLYAQGPFKSAGFTGTVLWAFEVFDNVNFVIQRTKEYQTFGRSQTEAEAKQVDLKVLGLIDALGMVHNTVIGSDRAPHEIYGYLRMMEEELQRSDV
jgi:ABC-type oligopeptide transport system ATPase subunit